MGIFDPAISFGSAGMYANNVTRQREVHRINSPSSFELIFVAEDISNVPSTIGDYKLKSQSIDYKYAENKTLVTTTAVYEQKYNLNEIVDFSDAIPKRDSSSNYFPYYTISQGDHSNTISFPVDWKIYLNQDPYITVGNIISELTGKGGYYFDYLNKKLSKVGTATTLLTRSDLFETPTFSLKTNLNNTDVQIYIIAKDDTSSLSGEPYFIEREVPIEVFTEVEGDPNPQLAPDNVTEIHDLSLNHDLSGEKKTRREITRVGDKTLKEKTTTYGFEYIAYGNIDPVSNQGFQINITNPSSYWRKIEEVIKNYEYSDEGYLTRITTSGFKRGRFFPETDNKTTGYETHRYGDITFAANGQVEKNDDHNPWKRQDYLFKSFPITGLLERQYHPLVAYFDNVSGRQFENVFIRHSYYDDLAKKVQVVYFPDKNWFEPYFLTSEYSYQACIGYSYNQYINADGEYEIESGDVVVPAIFGESRTYKKDFSFRSNKRNPDFISNDINITYVEKNRQNSWSETTTVYQTGNSGFREIAEKTETRWNTGTPPTASRKVESEYQYDINNTTESYIEIPSVEEESDYDVVIITPIGVESDNTSTSSEMDDEEILSRGSFIKPNDYDFVTSGNIREASSNIVTRVKLHGDNSGYEVGQLVTLNYSNMDLTLLVVGVSVIKDTTDRYSNGLFPDGSVRTHVYTELELGLYKNYYTESTTSVSESDDDEVINAVMPVIRNTAIGYARTATESSITNIPNRGNAVLPYFEEN